MMNQIKRVVYELKDLRKDYGNHTVLQIGHLEFHPGTIYGIVGSIGSGKSTLLRLLGGKEKETSGFLKYDDDTFKTGWFGKIKSNEDIFLASVDFFHKNQNVHEALKNIHPKKLDVINGRYFSKGPQKVLWNKQIGTLSPGEKSWLNNIMAVYSDPRVLLIDDYGTTIDNKMEFDFRKRLIKMNKDLGTTIIAVAPDDFHLKKFAAVLIYLDNGHVSKIRPGKTKSQGKFRKKT
tara:strand:- start:106 stop:807 length:702 start_codon:yes stop_codon:yes gene_type:complete